MKIIIAIALIFLPSLPSFAGLPLSEYEVKPNYKLCLEPGIGISPMPLTDMNFSTIIQYRFSRRFSVVSYSSIKENNLFLRNFNYIKSTDNYTLSQKFGIGTSFITRREIHTFSLIGGVNFTHFKELMNNPNFEKSEFSMRTFSPDAGILYSLKHGRRKCYFTYRMYIPLYPYPIKTADITGIDGNMVNLTLEMGLGIRLK